MRAVTPSAPGSPPAGGATSGRRAGTGATFPAPPARPRWPRPAEGVERPGGAVGPARGTEQPRGRQPGTPHPGSAGRRHRAGRRPNRRATGPRPGSRRGGYWSSPGRCTAPCGSLRGEKRWRGPRESVTLCVARRRGGRGHPHLLLPTAAGLRSASHAGANPVPGTVLPPSSRGAGA